MSRHGDRDARTGLRTQPNLKQQLLQVFDLQGPPDVVARRRRALLEFAETLESQDPLWTVMGVRRPSSEEEFMAFLRELCSRAGLSYQQIASRTEFDTTVETVPKSTVHGVLRRDRLPRREDQLRALLVVLIRANHGSVADLDRLLDLRAQLVASRTKAVAEPSPSGHATIHSEHEATPTVALVDGPATDICARCQHGRGPLELARVASLLLIAFAISVLMVIAVFRFLL